MTNGRLLLAYARNWHELSHDNRVRLLSLINSYLAQQEKLKTEEMEIMRLPTTLQMIAGFFTLIGGAGTLADVAITAATRKEKAGLTEIILTISKVISGVFGLTFASATLLPRFFFPTETVKVIKP
jgi:hypothetical protein